MRRAITLAGALFLAAVAGCGGAAATGSPTAASGNTRVCEHYRAQRAIVLGNATPGLSTAVKFIGWVAADTGQAAPGTPLARDLNRMLATMRSGAGSTYNTSRQVLADCEALGVKFTR